MNLAEFQETLVRTFPGAQFETNPYLPLIDCTHVAAFRREFKPTRESLRAELDALFEAGEELFVLARGSDDHRILFFTEDADVVAEQYMDQSGLVYQYFRALVARVTLAQLRLEGFFEPDGMYVLSKRGVLLKASRDFAWIISTETLGSKAFVYAANEQ